MTLPQVYIIQNGGSITDIKEMLTKHGGYKHVGIIFRTDKITHQSHETRKTLVICDSYVMESVKANEKRIITDYDWNMFPLPKEVNDRQETWDLHVSCIPNTYTSKQGIQMVKSLLMNIIPENKFTIFLPTRSRQTDEIYGYGTVKFDETVDRELIKLCKLVLHHAYIPNCVHTVRCIWNKEKQETVIKGSKTVNVVDM